MGTEFEKISELSDEEFLEHMSQGSPLSDFDITEEEKETSPEVLEEKEQEEEVEADAPAEEESQEEVEENVENPQEGGEEASSPDTPPKEAKEENTSGVDYKSFYERVMSPLKANGKVIEIRSPEEAIQLMQMGANYTRKMQDIAPHRKVLLMLENNGLLDETKLSYLIDLDKKNPEAIKRLVKDAGLDPLDIDTAQEPAYTVGNHHGVTDQEANFRTVLDELISIPTGQETVRIVNQWDQASKQKLWEEPGAMMAIHQQRENGIYDLITAEIDRQRALGTIPINTSFLDAYIQVGDVLRQAGALGNVQQESPKPSAPLATKVAAPKTRVDNNDRAKAAAPSTSTSKKAAPLVNPLAMSDDEFLKQMANRV